MNKVKKFNASRNQDNEINEYATKNHMNPISVAINGDYEALVVFEPIVEYKGD